MQLLLQIQLLGGFSFIYEGKPVESINTARVQSLLAFLVLNADIPQTRQHLAFLLWPDTSESNARNNLRQYCTSYGAFCPTLLVFSAPMPIPSTGARMRVK